MVVLISLVGCCLSKSIMAALALISRTDNRAKGNLVTCFVLCVLFLYNGLLLDSMDIGLIGKIIRFFSFFYWGANVLLYNELGGSHEGVVFLQERQILAESPSFAYFMLYLQAGALAAVFVWLSVLHAKQSPRIPKRKQN